MASSPPDFSGFVYSGPGATPDATTAPAAPQPTPQQPPAPTPPGGTQLGSMAPQASPDQGPGGLAVPAPYQGPALRGGPVKNALTRMFYGMGQSMLQHVGLPTDYDIQRTQYQQALQANEQQLRQAQFNWQQSQTTVMTPYGPVSMPLAVAQKMGPAWAQYMGKAATAQTTTRFQKVPNVGLFDTQPQEGGQPRLVPGSNPAGADLTPELATELGIPSDSAFIGQHLTFPQLNSLGAAFGRTLGTAGTRQTVVTDAAGNQYVATLGSGTQKVSPFTGRLGTAAPAVGPASTGGTAALPAIPQPVQSPLLPPLATGPLTQTESDRLAQFGINAPAGTQPITTPQTPPPATPSIPPAVMNRLPPTSPAGRALIPGAGQLAPLIGPGGQQMQSAKALDWVIGTEPGTNREVAVPAGDAAKYNLQDVGKLNPTEQTAMLNARQAYQNYTKVGDPGRPDTWGVLQLIDSLDKGSTDPATGKVFPGGQLGTFTSRFNAFLTRNVGASPGDDPRIIALLDKNHLGATKTMLGHIGKARAPETIRSFMDMANAGTMDAPTLRAGTLALIDYNRDAGMMPSAAQAPTPQLQAIPQAPSGIPSGAIRQYSPSTQQWRYSTDGGKTWQMAKP